MLRMMPVLFNSNAKSRANSLDPQSRIFIQLIRTSPSRGCRGMLREGKAAETLHYLASAQHFMINNAAAAAEAFFFVAVFFSCRCQSARNLPES